MSGGGLETGASGARAMLGQMRLVQALLLLAVLWAGIYLPGLGGEELKGEEPRRVLPGLEMMRSGDWTSPVVAGEAYHRKPPLINWLAAGGVMATGRVDEFSARWPVAVLVLLFALGLCAGVRRAAGMEAGFLAGVFALTNIGMMEKGRLVEIEGAYISLTGLAFAAWLAFVAPAMAEGAPRRRPWLGWVLAGVLSGLAFLAKGPPHLVMFYAVAAGVWWKTGRWRDALHPAHGAGLLAGAAVAAPWFLASRGVAAGEVREGTDGGADWTGELTSRLDVGAMDFPGWVLQFFQGLLNFSPWIFMLLALLIPAVRRRLELAHGGRLVMGLLAGCMLGYLMIALTPAARPRFTLPLIGPAAAALAMVLAGGGAASVFHGVWKISIRVVAGVVVLAALALPWFGVPGGRVAAVAAAVLAVALAAWVWISMRRRGNAEGLGLASGGLMVAIALLYAGGVQGIKARSEELRPTGLRVRELLAPGEQAMLYRAGLQPWVFYAWEVVRETPYRDRVPEPLPGPVIFLASKWPGERAKFEKRFGPATEETVVPNPWNKKDLMLVRFAGKPAR